MQLAQGIAALIAVYAAGVVALSLYATVWELNAARVKSSSRR